MIDQTKDKKDDAVAQKLDAKKQDAVKAQQLAKEEKEKAELQKAQAKNEKVKAQPETNMAKAMQPIGSAKVTADKAEIHAEPEKKGAVIGTFSNQQKVDILERKGNELKVLVNGKVGYISAKETDDKSAAKEEKKVPQPIGKAKVAALALKIHREAGKDSESFGTLRQGDNVNIYAEKDGFLEVHVGDEVGYIAAEFTDHAGREKNKEIKPEEGDALAKAPEALQAILLKEKITVSEVAEAREMIGKCSESARGPLYEALMKKQTAREETKKRSKDPHEYDNLAASLEMLGVQNPVSDISYTAYLEQVRRDQRLPENGGMQNWGSMVNAMGISYSMLTNSISNTGDRQAHERGFWAKAAREQLQKGHAVMACINHQAVRIEAVDDKGLVMTLPNGEAGLVSGLNGFDSYTGKEAVKGHGKHGILSFDALGNTSIDWVMALG